MKKPDKKRAALYKTKKQQKIRRDELNKRLIFAAQNETQAFLDKYGKSSKGLDEDTVEKNRDEYGDNVITHGKKKSIIKRIGAAFINPFTLILLFLAAVSVITDIVVPIWRKLPGDINYVTVIIIAVMVVFSGGLRFVQETRSGNAADKLLAMITTTTCVEREGEGRQEIPLEEVVVGDIIHLAAGDMVPADIRIIEAKDLFISQSQITGESEPLEKLPAVCGGEFDSVTEFNNMAFMGSNVISGAAAAVAVAVGDDTMFGSMAQLVTGDKAETSFQKGINSVSMLLIRFMFIMIPIVFIVNGITKRDWVEALLFGISIAVGLTPEMLPMIVTTCLAKGAVSMSKKKTIIKNLNSIQNFGAIDILCTDKTGTLTQDRVVLEYHLDVHGNEDARVLRHAYLNSYYQTGYKNLMDHAIIERTEEQETANPALVDLSAAYKKVDEVPFDFTRRRLSVVVEDKKGKTQMITKGAVEEMLSVCSFAEYQGKVEPLTEEIKKYILKKVDVLNNDGMRVIAVAQKTNPSPVGLFSAKDECEMVLIGYLAFLDPPKLTTKDAIKALKEYGVTTKILTGDNDKVTRCICKQVGLKVHNLLLGSDIEKMTEEELAAAVEQTSVFAKLSPDQKARVVTRLRDNGHIVGYMGDGINDAAAMKASDVGISVDTAVDIAKESADIILLEKDLMVLEQGIIEGRKTYANMIKYIKMTASSNFGNMFSVLAASALLPFLPMKSIHLIILNLIYDISCTAIPWDNVDEEYLKIPRKWEANAIGSFMMWIGPTSSIFDWLTYSVMFFIICPIFAGGAWGTPGCDTQHFIALFQAGWFVESMWSQTLVIHMIRTPKIPFIQSRASLPVTLTTFTGIAALTAIPFTPLGKILDLAPLPGEFFIFLVICILLYMALATTVKKAYVRHFGKLL